MNEENEPDPNKSPLTLSLQGEGIFRASGEWIEEHDKTGVNGWEPG